MKLVVFGATGSVGRKVIEDALTQGHEVTALARDPAALSAYDGRITVQRGDILDAQAVVRAVDGQDAVVCALGRPLLDRSGLREAGTRKIVRAMQSAGVRRLVVLSALGVGDSAPVLPWLYRRILLPTMFRRAFADHLAQEQVVRDSGLDWVIVRAVNFTDGAPDGRFHSGVFAATKGMTLKISRADLAGFLLRQLREDRYLGQAPGISN